MLEADEAVFVVDAPEPPELEPPAPRPPEPATPEGPAEPPVPELTAPEGAAEPRDPVPEPPEADPEKVPCVAIHQVSHQSHRLASLVVVLTIRTIHARRHRRRIPTTDRPWIPIPLPTRQRRPHRFLSRNPVTDRWRGSRVAFSVVGTIGVSRPAFCSVGGLVVLVLLGGCVLGPFEVVRQWRLGEPVVCAFVSGLGESLCSEGGASVSAMRRNRNSNSDGYG